MISETRSQIQLFLDEIEAGIANDIKVYGIDHSLGCSIMVAAD